MGDGQHGWAAAEWIMIVRNLLIREEREKVVIGSGIFPEWLREPGKIHFGPTLTPAGRISITPTPRATTCRSISKRTQRILRRPSTRSYLHRVIAPGAGLFEAMKDLLPSFQPQRFYLMRGK